MSSAPVAEEWNRRDSAVVAACARSAVHEDGFGWEGGARISTMAGGENWRNGIVTQDELCDRIG